MIALVGTMLLYLLSIPLSALDGTNDPSFNPGDAGFGSGSGFWISTVRVVKAQPDGKFLIGGSFNEYNDNLVQKIVRIYPDGEIDMEFSALVGHDVYAIAIQDDGKILIGGVFTSVNNTARSRIARLNSDGTLDASFDPGTGFNSTVSEIIVQDDGKILVLGTFSTFNGTNVAPLVRLDENGHLDTEFNTGTGFDGAVNAIALQDDGRILVGGEFATYDGTARGGIVRLQSNGALDEAFDPGTGFNGKVVSLAVQPDGKIIASGNFSDYNGETVTNLCRIEATGSFDGEFTGSLSAAATTIIVDGDDKILLAGDFTQASGVTRRRVARLETDGSIDVGFDPSTNNGSSISSIAIGHDGGIVVVGNFSSFGGTFGMRIAKLKADGSVDENFSKQTGFQDDIFALAVQSDGKVLVGGRFISYNGESEGYLIRINPDGSRDTEFQTGLNLGNFVYAFGIQPDGKILVGGQFVSPTNKIIRLETDGSRDLSFVPGSGFNQTPRSFAFQSDGKIIVGGDFTSFNSVSRNRITRLNSDGSLDTDFDPGTGFDQIIHAVALVSDDKVLVGGRFSSFNGTAVNRMCRLNADGSIDATFNVGTGFDNNVYKIVVLADGRIIAAGAFADFNGAARARIAMLRGDGTLDTSFVPADSVSDYGSINDIVVQAHGKIIAAFSSGALFRFNTDGSIDDSFESGTGFNDDVTAIALQETGKLIAAGYFTSYNSTGRNRIARIVYCDSPVITTQPVSTSTCDGGALKFNVEASAPGVNYQWQENSGSGFSDLTEGGIYSGTDGPALTISDPAGLNGNEYRVVIEGHCVSNITSDAATLGESTYPIITANPVDQITCEGNEVAMTVTTTGSTSIQWQVNDGSGFSNISDDDVYDGANTASLTISSTNAPLDGHAYRAIVANNGCKIISDAASLTVQIPATITSQPEDLTVCAGSEGAFTTTATGSELNYQWQVNSGAGFTDLAENDTYSGTRTNTLKLSSVDREMDELEYRVVVSAACGDDVQSDAVTLSVDNNVEIITNPVNVTVCEGSDISLTVEASGSDLEYQWHENGEAGFVDLENSPVIGGVNAPTLVLNEAPTALNGKEYRVVVTGVCGSATSDEALLIVNAIPAKPVITESFEDHSQPVLTSSYEDGNQWYRDGELLEGETANTLLVDEPGSYQVQVALAGCESELSEAKLIVITSLETSREPLISVYPNPTKSQLVVRAESLDHIKPADIVVTDVMGRVFEQRSAQGVNEITLNLERYADGFYLLTIRQGARSQVIKIQKRSN